MKLVIIEPLGVERDRLLHMAHSALKDSVEIVYYDTKTTDTEELIERGKDAEIIVTANNPINEQVIHGWRRLKLLSVAFTGIDHIARDACDQNGVMVCNCAGYSTAAVSDLVFGMLIMLYRNLAACDREARNEGTKDGLIGCELEGKKFGVIGTGATGSRVAEIAAAFGCQVLAYSRSRKETVPVQYVSLDELMAESDIISIHVPSNSETRGLIGAEKIAKMKSNAVLINTARGPVIDSQALADALNSEKIAGACIDVFETEPPISKSHPLVTAKNTVLAPHVAFASREAMIKRAVIAFENAAKYLNGTPQNVM